MNKALELFGEIVGKQSEIKPERARGMLSTAFLATAFVEQNFPSKKKMEARRYITVKSHTTIAKGLKDKKRAAVVNIFLPCEILHAMGIYPQFPEAMSCYLAATASEGAFISHAERFGVPESLCSYHKILIGLAESGVMATPKFVLNTTLACDANQLSFRRIASHFNVPHVVLDIPHSYSKENLQYVADQLRDMVQVIEENSDFRLDMSRLQEAVEHSRNTIENYRAYLKARSTRFVSDEMTSEMLSVFATHVMCGTKEAEIYTKRLLEQVEALPQHRPAVRILWVHTLPYWQDSLREILDFNERYEIVACDMNFDSLVDMNPDKPYESMARRLLENSMNGPASRRIDLIEKMSKELHADGVIWFCHWGCKQTLAASQLAKKTLEANGIPVLILDGDGADRSNYNDGQMRTRVQAFLELLEGKK